MDTEQLLWLPDPKQKLCFQTTFSLFFTYFQNWEFAYSLSMLILVPKGLIKMKKKKKMIDYHAWFWIGVIFWC